MKIRTAFAGCLLFLGMASASLGQQVVATGRAIQNPQVAVAGTGDTMIVWGDLDSAVHASSFSLGVFARLYDASGQPKGRPFLVSENRAGHQLLPQVAADGRGNFIVVWQGGFGGERGDSSGGDGNGAGVFAQRFDRNGTRLGPSFRLSRIPAGDQLTPNVAMASDGSFVAVWQDCAAARRRCSELHAGRFTASGERKGEELEIPVLTATFYLDGSPVPNTTPHVVLEPGGFAIGWTEQEACYKYEYEKFPVVVHFTDSGQPVGERYRLDDGTCEGTGWSLAALTASRTGSSAAFFNGGRNSFQLFEPGGDPAGARKVVGQRTAACCEVIGDAAMASGGNFAVVWNREPSAITGKGYSLQAQLFDSSGSPVSGRIPVASSPLQFSAPAAAFTPDGSLLVVWADPQAGPNDPNAESPSLLSKRIRRS